MYTEQIIKIEATFIEDTKTSEEIKELLGADKIDILKEQIFEHEGEE